MNRIAFDVSVTCIDAVRIQLWKLCFLLIFANWNLITIGKCKKKPPACRLCVWRPRAKLYASWLMLLMESFCKICWKFAVRIKTRQYIPTYQLDGRKTVSVEGKKWSFFEFFFTSHNQPHTCFPSHCQLLLLKYMRKYGSCRETWS